MTRPPIPPAALWLGALGALPFIALAAAHLMRLFPWSGLALMGYGAVILSFMGGVHWGSAMAQETPTWQRLGASVLPSLLGAAALLAGGRIGFLLVAGGLVALLVYDLGATQRGETPLWYPNLRLPLTVIAVASLCAGAMG